MDLEDEIGRRKFLRTAGGLLVMAGTGKLLSACGDEPTDEQCHDPRVWNGDECVEPTDGNGSEILLYDDFREDSGLWDITLRESHNPQASYLNYTENGLEFINYNLYGNDTFQVPNSGALNLEIKWKVPPTDSNPNLIIKLHSPDWENQVDLRPHEMSPEADIWFTTKATIDRIGIDFFIDEMPDYTIHHSTSEFTNNEGDFNIYL
ncbi:MAG: hypothetical protein ABIH82_06265, partial [Candidatus Woesearchaeota archaeon]